MNQTQEPNELAQGAREQNRGAFPLNWKWVLLGITVGVVAFLSVIFVSVISLMHESEPFQHSLAMVRDNPRVEKALGNPLEPAFLVNGNLETDGNIGFAKMNYEILGPKGTATVYLDAEQEHGRWRFYTLIVATPTEDIVLANAN